MGGTSLLEQFSAPEDPRQIWKVVYPLPEVLLLVLCATLAGAEDFVEVVRWGRGKLGFLRRFLPFEHGVPSHDTLGDVVSGLDPALFRAAFAAWVEDLREAEPDIVAIDGKTSRRSHDRAKGRSPLHLVSAWASRQRLVLGQQATAPASNEAEAVPLLLERLALTGALVTIDAMGATPRIARAVLDRGADYLLALKANQGHLFEEAELYFRDAANTDTEADRCETVDADHGRIETRRHVVSRDVDWLRADRAAPGEPRFPGLKAIARAEAEVETGGGRTTLARRYYLSSTPLDARTFARAVRAHWGVENRLHWVLDVVFHDDLARLRTGHGPENMAVVRHMVLNLLNKTAKTDSLKTRRKRAGWDDDYLQAVVTQAA
jgi:predicted transposase YbfD/YdcC